MGVNEIRIGNFVSLSGELQLKVIEITTVAFYAMDKKGENFKSSWADIQPIPLTEEWLLKFGFEKIKSGYEEAETYDFYNENLYFNMANQSIKINGNYAISFIPDYVHQLQNLYFALTNTELKLEK